MKGDFVVSINLNILDWDLENMLLLIPLISLFTKWLYLEKLCNLTGN